MALPSSTMTATDYNLGVVSASPGQNVVKVGPCSSGTIGALVWPSNKTDLVSTHQSGPTVEAAALAFDYPGHGGIGVMRAAASVAGTVGSVTKTDPSTATGPAVVFPGSFTLAGADTDGDILFTEKNTAVSATLAIAVAGAVSVAVVANAVTLTITNTTTATDAAAALNGDAGAFALFGATALGTGASVCPQTTAATSALNGRLSVTPLKAGVSVVVVVPSTANQAFSATFSNSILTVNVETNAKKKPVTTATTVKTSLDALAAASPGSFSVALPGTGANPPGAKASTSLSFGSTASMTVSGDPLDAWRLRVKGTRAGAATVGAFRWSLDGTTYSDEISYPAGGVYAIAGSGLTITLSGTLAVNDLFSATCTAPTMSNGDLSNAMDALIALASTNSFSIVHVVGAVDATAFAILSTKAAAFEAATRYVTVICETVGQASNQTASQWSAAVISDFANSADKRIMPCAGECELVSTLSQPQAGRTQRRPNAWALAARAGAVPISEDLGRVASGPLLGVVSLYHLSEAAVLDQNKFATIYALSDYAGFYGQGRLKSPSGSDFVYIQDIRVLNEVMRLGYRGQTRYLNDSLRVRTAAAGPYPAGSIDPADALTVETYLNAILREGITKPGYATRVVATVDRTINLVTQKNLKVKYDCVPLGTIKTINGVAGLSNPALAAV